MHESPILEWYGRVFHQESTFYTLFSTKFEVPFTRHIYPQAKLFIPQCAFVSASVHHARLTRMHIVRPTVRHTITLESINLARFTFLDPGNLFLRNKSYWIQEGPSKSVQVSSCGHNYANTQGITFGLIIFCQFGNEQSIIKPFRLDSH